MTRQSAANARSSEITAFLLSGRNGDGGWGYFAGRKSRLEPTCWAALALHSADREAPAALRRWPARDGLLLERDGGEPNYAFHGLALLTLLACGVDHDAGNAALVDGIQRVQGLTFDASPYFRQNNGLVGWSWVERTFGWVEPTAWCLLALKKWRPVAGTPVDAHRIDQAEQLLSDRVCEPGGWNYGNSNALGQQLQPYVPTTAIGLLAMQDRAGDDAVRRSLAFLESEATSERSGAALSLASMALGVHRRPFAPVRLALDEQVPVTLALGNLCTAAMASVALGGEAQAGAFRI